MRTFCQAINGDQPNGVVGEQDEFPSIFPPMGEDETIGAMTFPSVEKDLRGTIF